LKKWVESIDDKEERNRTIPKNNIIALRDKFIDECKEFKYTIK
jgi:hypothetical protein